MTRVVVLAKAPRPGAVKTRLAVSLGPQLAASLAAAMLEDTWATVRALEGTEARLALDGEPGLLPEHLSLRSGQLGSQGDGDLGARLARQLAAPGRGDRLVLGTDAVGLPAPLIRRALGLLATHDAVLGPSEDGGYWGIGVRAGAATPDLLDGLPWSTSETLAATERRLNERGLRVARAPRWFDVDDAGDLARAALLLDAGAVRSPAVHRALRRARPRLPPPAAATPSPRPSPTWLSVIVPTLNEAGQLPGLLASLVGQPGLDELLVADGGSDDGTPALADAFPGVRLVRAPRGRARQMNAGAEAAHGSVLWFLHADVRLPPDAAAHVATALADPRVVAGAFLTRTVPSGAGRDPRRPSGPARHSRRWHLGRLLRLADLRSRYTRRPYGDQALFCRATAFAAVGGYPDQPLLEDLELSRRLARRGRLARCSAEVTVSGRRFEARPLYYTALVNVFPLLYRLGVPAAALARLYRHTR